MALPTGYDQIPWHDAEGWRRGLYPRRWPRQALWPYKVIDPNTRLVDDISTVGGFSTGQFNIGPNEIVGAKHRHDHDHTARYGLFATCTWLTLPPTR